MSYHAISLGLSSDVQDLLIETESWGETDRTGRGVVGEGLQRKFAPVLGVNTERRLRGQHGEACPDAPLISSRKIRTFGIASTNNKDTWHVKH